MTTPLTSHNWVYKHSIHDYYITLESIGSIRHEYKPHPQQEGLFERQYNKTPRYTYEITYKIPDDVDTDIVLKTDRVTDAFFWINATKYCVPKHIHKRVTFNQRFIHSLNRDLILEHMDKILEDITEIKLIKENRTLSLEEYKEIVAKEFDNNELWYM